MACGLAVETVCWMAGCDIAVVSPWSGALSAASGGFSGEGSVGADTGAGSGMTLSGAVSGGGIDWGMARGLGEGGTGGGFVGGVGDGDEGASRSTMITDMAVSVWISCTGCHSILVPISRACTPNATPRLIPRNQRSRAFVPMIVNRIF